MKRSWYWVGFVACQAAGAVLPLFGNVHLNIGPVLLAFILLLPGDLIVLRYEQLPLATQIAVVVPINFGVWWLVGRTAIRKEGSGR